MHLALSNDVSDAAFIPETFNDEYTDWLLDSCESLLKRRLRLTKDCYSTLDETGQDLSKFFISNAARIREYFSRIKKQSFQSLRIRIHGDYHLGQVLLMETIISLILKESRSSIRTARSNIFKDVVRIRRSYAVSAKLYFSPNQNFPGKLKPPLQHGHKVTEVFEFLPGYDGRCCCFSTDNRIDFILQFHLLKSSLRTGI
jgi:maltose alpha-D-glucosyltransferase/alpha-amylase